MQLYYSNFTPIGIMNSYLIFLIISSLTNFTDILFIYLLKVNISLLLRYDFKV